MKRLVDGAYKVLHVNCGSAVQSFVTVIRPGLHASSPHVRHVADDNDLH